MSTEEQYKIAMIVLAGVSGALLLILIVACCFCCRYKRQLKGGGSGTRVVKHRISTRKSHHYETSPYEAWGSSLQGRSCGCQGTSGCSRCQGHGSAYDWLSSPAMPNPYSATPSTQIQAYNPYSMTSGAHIQAPSPGFGRVRLNAPSAVCSQPKLNTTPIGGGCATGGNAYNMVSSQPTGNNLACSTAQFVLESAGKRC